MAHWIVDEIERLRADKRMSGTALVRSVREWNSNPSATWRHYRVGDNKLASLCLLEGMLRLFGKKLIIVDIDA